MKVEVHYINGEAEVFTNVSSTIWKRKSTLRLNLGDKQEINIPAENIRYWNVVK